MGHLACRACRSESGALVLDLGEQPASDHFPEYGDPGSDPLYPLQMWLCATCGLAQLAEDPTVPEEPRGAEPAALVNQAADAVNRVASAGLLPEGARVIEYGSPHGGSWLDLLFARGLRLADEDEPADVVLDCFGLMHAVDQADALAERVRRLAPGGTLLLQYHCLDTIVRMGQWNALRHGHFAYYSTTALSAMLAKEGFAPSDAWEFELYGGTVLLAARAANDGSAPSEVVSTLLQREDRTGVTRPDVLAALQRDAESRAGAVRRWLEDERAAGRTVVGYGAASRAVALLRRAEVQRSLLGCVVDASTAKQGRRMPGTDIPIVAPSTIEALQPDAVLLFLPDLMAEVRASFPSVEASGGRWVDAESLTS